MNPSDLRVDERWLPNDELLVTFTTMDEIKAWFRLQYLSQTERLTGRDVGAVVHVVYARVEEDRSGPQIALMWRVVCEMIRATVRLSNGRAKAVVIDPLDDAAGIQRALARRDVAVKSTAYPWAYIIPMRAMSELERRYCRWDRQGPT